MLYDLVAQQAQASFYEVPRDLRVEQGQYASCSDTSCAITSSRRSTSPEPR